MKTTLAIFSVLSVFSVCHADEVEDLIKAAYKHYQASEMQAASEKLIKANELITQQRGEVASEWFPKPAENWKADEPVKEDMKALGGGLNLSRLYTNLKDKQTAKIQLILDSPLMQKLAPLLTNPVVSQGMGFETKRVNGEEALMKVNGLQGEMNFILGERLMLKLETSGMKSHEISDFARELDFQAIRKFE